MTRRALISSIGAPVFLIGGWTLAAQLQPGGFDSITDTISELASREASYRWVMTAAFVGTGLCHLVTASGVPGVPKAGRIAIAVGGASLIGVAAFPISAASPSPAHAVFALTGFTALAVWPVLGKRARNACWALRLRVAAPASAVMLALVGSFLAEQLATGDYIGLTERLAAGAEALWPLITVLSLSLSANATGVPVQSALNR